MPQAKRFELDNDRCDSFNNITALHCTDLFEIINRNFS